MRSNPRGQRNVSSLIYALMLFRQVQQLGIFDQQRGRKLPRVTLAIAATCFVFYFFGPDVQRFLPFNIDNESSAINPYRMMKSFWTQWPRIFLAALAHGSDQHLYYNLVSLLYKGSLLEGRFGSTRFAVMATGLTAAAHLLMVGLSYLFYSSPLWRFSDYHADCVGISALLFAFKVIVNHDPRMVNAQTNVGGFMISNRWAAWAELVFIQLAIPNASFMGHLGGILAGLGYVAISAPDASLAARRSPLLLLLAPIRWIYQRVTRGRNDEGAGDRLRFNHDPNGYVIGRRPGGSSPSAPGGPASSSSSSSASFRGAAHRFPSPSAPDDAAREENLDDEVQFVTPPPSAPAAVDDSAKLHAGRSGRSSSPSPYSREMDVLWSMGLHDRKANYRALKDANGNIQTAIDRLIGPQ